MFKKDSPVIAPKQHQGMETTKYNKLEPFCICECILRTPICLGRAVLSQFHIFKFDTAIRLLL